MTDAIKTARELVLLPYTQRTVTERRGGRGGAWRPRRPRGPRPERAGRRDDAGDEAATEVTWPRPLRLEVVEVDEVEVVEGADESEEASMKVLLREDIDGRRPARRHRQGGRRLRPQLPVPAGKASRPPRLDGAQERVDARGARPA